MKSGFQILIESIHLPGLPDEENVSAESTM